MTGAEPEGKIKFPEEWFTAPWERCELLQVLTIKRSGEQMFFAGGTLDDGSCLYGLSFPGGQRVMRLSPLTGWSIEERFRGQPRSAIRDVVMETWRMCIKSLVVAKQKTEAMLGPAKGNR